MKRLPFLLLFSVLVLFVACSNEPKSTEPTDEPTTPVVEADAEQHGCKASEGYSWSVVKNECIALFQSGIKLEPIDSFMPKHQYAFVVFKSDTEDEQAEVFLPIEKKSLVLSKVAGAAASTWKNEDLTLTQLSGSYSLVDNKKVVLYQGKALAKGRL